jgi:hypothetical protein
LLNKKGFDYTKKSFCQKLCCKKGGRAISFAAGFYTILPAYEPKLEVEPLVRGPRRMRFRYVLRATITFC